MDVFIFLFGCSDRPGVTDGFFFRLFMGSSFTDYCSRNNIYVFISEVHK